MKTQNEIVSKLKEHQPSTPSKWRDHAEWRRTNKHWLRYSQRIACILIDRMEEQHMTKEQLAERMGCSLAYVSNLLRGQENLSLETICKIEESFGLQIISPDLKVE